MLQRRKFIKWGLLGLAGSAGLFSCLKFYEKRYTPAIVTYPDPILRRRATPIDGVDDALRSLARSMVDALQYRAVLEFFLKASMYKGLAAPQVGCSRRLIVCGVHGRMLTMVNPEIVEQEGIYANSEYCMSLPGHPRRLVNRANIIKVTYRDLENAGQTLVARGSAAGLVQHEIDHLDGKLYIDT